MENRGRDVPLVAAAVEETARTSPDAPAITDVMGTVCYAELEAMIARARGPIEAVSRRGDVVEIEMAPRTDRVAALLACEATGRSALLLPAGLPAGEALEARRNSGARFVIADGVIGARGSVRLLPTGAQSDAATPHGIAQLTSGSLGPSQLALRGWRGIHREIDAVAARLALVGSDRVLCASSIAHSYGLIGGLLTPLTRGAHVTLASPDLTGMALSSPTVLFGLARTYQAMLDREKPALGPQATRFALSAGAPLPPGLFNAMRRRTGIAIRQDYGTTETGTISIDDLEPAQPGSVGRPLDHMDARIAHDGEIQVRSEAVAPGYLVQGEVVPCVDAEGWYHTRDAGSLRAGVLSVGRRIRLPVHVARETIRLEDLEEAIAGVPGVREAVVLPMGHGADAGLRAVVATSLDAGALTERLARLLPADRRPREIEIVDALPRSPAGKVLQKYLA